MTKSHRSETVVCERSGKPCPYAELALQSLGVKQTNVITELSEHCVEFVQTLERSRGIFTDCAVAAATILFASKELADA